MSDASLVKLGDVIYDDIENNDGMSSEHPL